MSPQRIQRKRPKGWRMSEGAVYVGRPSKWGNPFVVGQTQIRVPGLSTPWEFEGRLHKTTGERAFFCTGTDDLGLPVGFWHHVQQATAEQCVELFRMRMLRLDVGNVSWGAPIAEIRAELRGKDLACWCSPGQPCHADVLLEIANGDTP